MPDFTFLTAHWSDLILAQYDVPEAILAPYLPPGLEPDRWEGRCQVSLVAFDFLDTRVAGVPWPGFRHFPEWNLRAYVRERATGQRGVIFIKEVVPQAWVAFVARALYGEPYIAAPMKSRIRRESGDVHAKYDVKWRGRTMTAAVRAEDAPFTPAEDSLEHFFKEHAWGYNATRGRTIRYHVVHPTWRVRPVRDYRLDFSARALYGESWAFLDDAEPHSVVFAEGSEVKVYWKGKL